MSNSWYDTLTSTPALIATALGVSVAALFVTTRNTSNSNNNNTAAQIKEQVKEVAQSVHAEGSKGKMAQAGASIMSAPAANLAPPKDDPITPAQLAKHDGSDPSKPIYVAIKGKVFDVSSRGEMYAPGKGYNVFAGKDGSKGLGMSSLDPRDAVADYSSLNEGQMNTLNQWESFFEKRYSVPKTPHQELNHVRKPVLRSPPQPQYAPPAQYPPGDPYYAAQVYSQRTRDFADHSHSQAPPPGMHSQYVPNNGMGYNGPPPQEKDSGPGVGTAAACCGLGACCCCCLECCAPCLCLEAME
ncbi:hypothetical protein D1P53_000890 [Cryptococcus gattii VGV]|nr:hypothetical protein D1P53_000890 [Cryptococcus gattii VGV]